jgi:hypothetical protein
LQGRHPRVDQHLAAEEFAFDTAAERRPGAMFHPPWTAVDAIQACDVEPRALEQAADRAAREVVHSTAVEPCGIVRRSREFTKNGELPQPPDRPHVRNRQDELPTGTEDPPTLGKQRRHIWHQLQHGHRRHGIERRIFIWQRFGSSIDNDCPNTSLSCGVDRSRRHIEAMNLAESP